MKFIIICYTHLVDLTSDLSQIPQIFNGPLIALAHWAHLTGWASLTGRASMAR